MKIQIISSNGTVMKRLLTLTAALGLVAMGTVVANASSPVLFNGTLDILGAVGANGQNLAGPLGWSVTAVKTIGGQFPDGGDSETFCNVSPPSSPTGYGFFFKPFAGNLQAQDLLDVDLYQDNATTPGTTFVLSANAACEASYSGLPTNYISGGPGGTNTSWIQTNTAAYPKTYLYVEFMNSNGVPIVTNIFDLVAAGMPTGGSGSMASPPNPMTTPSYTAPAGAAIVRAGAAIRNTFSTGGAQSFFVDNMDLEATAAPGSPVITNQPLATTTAPGATVKLVVGVSNPAGVSYQWQLSNTNLSDGGEFSGTATSTLTITGISATDVGNYRVLVSNSSGASYSSTAAVALTTMALDPVIYITGLIGQTYRVDYTTNLGAPVWIPLSTNKLTTVPQPVVDTSGVGTTRFYRAVFLY